LKQLNYLAKFNSFRKEDKLFVGIQIEIGEEK